jgi:hypothetical protein
VAATRDIHECTGGQAAQAAQGWVDSARHAVVLIKKCKKSEYLFCGCGKFSAMILIAFLNSPCYETPKNTKKNRAKQNKKQVTALFLGLRQINVRHFRHF